MEVWGHISRRTDLHCFFFSPLIISLIFFIKSVNFKIWMHLYLEIYHMQTKAHLLIGEIEGCLKTQLKVGTIWGRPPDVLIL